MQSHRKLPFLRLELTQVRVCSFVLFLSPSRLYLFIYLFIYLFCGREKKYEIPRRKPLDESLAMNSISLKELISRGPAARDVITHL